MGTTYVTQFGSIDQFDKGRVEPINDNVKNYAFSNCFEIASKSKAWEKVVFGKNQIYVLEAVRIEGNSPWYTCAHDEFLLSMDADMEVHLIKLVGSQIIQDTEKNGAVLVQGEPQGAKMGWIHLQRGHQAMLPKNTAYQLRAKKAGVAVLQTCQGELSKEKWAEICQAH